MAMIAERKTENQQARLSNIQSSDVLRVLRMLPLIFLRKFFWFTTTLQSNRIFITHQINCLTKKYWMNALHLFSLELTLFPSLYLGAYTCYPFILPFRRDFETNFVMPWLATIMQMEILQTALRILAFTVAALVLILVAPRHYGARSRVFHTLKLWFAKPWDSVLRSMELSVLRLLTPISPCPVLLPCQLERSFIKMNAWKFEKGVMCTFP